MKTFLASATVAATMTFGGAATSAQAGSLDPFLVFGDSLSDAGFFFGLQATNGDTWAAQLGATTEPGTPSYNYAQLGALATGDRTLDLSPLGMVNPEDFEDQIIRFQSVAPVVTADTWTVAWFGGNDLLGAAAQISLLDPADPGFSTAAQAISTAAVSNAVTAISDGVTRLAKENALTKFILPGLPDLALVPQIAAAPVLAPFATGLSDAFNSALIGLAQTASLTVEYFDTEGVFNSLVAGSPGNGFAELTTPCDADLAALLSNCAGFLFFDSIHPTDAAHGILAAGIGDLMHDEASVVPLPAGVWLLLGGLSALAAARRARAKVAA